MQGGALRPHEAGTVVPAARDVPIRPTRRRQTHHPSRRQGAHQGASDPPGGEVYRLRARCHQSRSHRGLARAYEGSRGVSGGAEVFFRGGR